MENCIREICEAITIYNENNYKFIKIFDLNPADFKIKQNFTFKNDGDLYYEFDIIDSTNKTNLHIISEIFAIIK